MRKIKNGNISETVRDSAILSKCWTLEIVKNNNAWIITYVKAVGYTFSHIYFIFGRYLVTLFVDQDAM